MLLDYWLSASARRESAHVPEESKPTALLTAEDVFHAFAPRVYNLARRMMSNDADAEDVTQDVLLQVVRKLGSFRGEAEIFTWLHRVTVNAALGLRRQRSRRPELCLATPFDGFTNERTGTQPEAPDDRVLNQEAAAHLERAVASLPEIYRDVYVLADVEGLPNAEVGALLELSLPAVKSRLHRARLMLRDILAPYFTEYRP